MVYPPPPDERGGMQMHDTRRKGKKPTGGNSRVARTEHQQRDFERLDELHTGAVTLKRQIETAQPVAGQTVRACRRAKHRHKDAPSAPWCGAH
jgi:hypothetical protein